MVVIESSRRRFAVKRRIKRPVKEEKKNALAYFIEGYFRLTVQNL